jgi:hypothetical protein
MLKRLRTFYTRTGRTLAPSMALALTAGLLLAYCDNASVGGSSGGSDDLGDGVCVISNLTVSPDNDVIQVDLNTPGATAQKVFTVRSVCSNGNTSDITSQVTLSLDNPAVGSLNGNTFTSATNTSTQISFTRVTATYNVDGQTFTGVGNLTVVWLRTTEPATDLFFQLPYLNPSQNQPLQFSINIQSLDSFLAVDTTSSMTNSIVALRDSLQNTIIPGVKAAAAKDAWFGVGAVEDFPANNNGAPNCAQNPGGPDDQAFILLNGMSSDQATTSTNVGKLLVGGTKTRGCGADIAEGHIEALYQIATGKGNVVAGVSNIPANTTGIGGVGFRKGALPVVTMITDALFHTKGEGGQCRQTDTGGVTFTETPDYSGTSAAAAHTRAEMTTALQAICSKVIGVAVQRSSVFDGAGNRHTFTNGYCPATNDLIQLAQATGSAVPPQAWDIPARPNNCAAGLCCTGIGGAGEAPAANGLCPLVFKLPDDGSGLGAQVTSGITNVARFSSFTVTTKTCGNPTGDNGAPLPAGKTTADFITMITPASSTAPTAPPVLPAPVVSGGSFTAVYPGSTVSFTVTTQNNLVPEATTPQVCRANIKILAGGCADLDQREVIILVPPKPPTIG